MNIVAKRLYIDFWFRSNEISEKLLTSILRQLTKSGCLEDIHFNLDDAPEMDDDDYDDYVTRDHIPESVAKELVRTIDANQNLKAFKIHCGMFLMRWDKHFKEVLGALKRNRGLRHINMDKERVWYRDEYWYPIHIDRGIDGRFLYFNRLIRLTSEPQAIRQWLVGQALGGSTCDDFELCAWLLDEHIDTLCELLQESLDSAATIPSSIEEDNAQVVSSSIKRQGSRQQPLRAAKRR